MSGQVRVRVLYFAAVRDLVGIAEEDLALPAGVRSAADLIGHLERLRPELAGRLDAVRVAVNEAFADGGLALSEGDVVALIPPVAGG